MSKKPQLMGKKLGMTQFYDETGRVIVCTVIEVEPNVVTQIKSAETDGYNAVQSSFEKIKGKKQETIEKRCTKPMLGHFKKANVEPRRHVLETRLENVHDYQLGQELTIEMFAEHKYVDVIGTSKGKGYQGAMKKYHFRGAPASHGAKKNHRSLGSTGNRAGRCFPGGKRASQMGNERKVIESLSVYRVDVEKNLLLVKGAIPGARNGLVVIRDAVKKVGK